MKYVRIIGTWDFDSEIFFSSGLVWKFYLSSPDSEVVAMLPMGRPPCLLPPLLPSELGLVAWRWCARLCPLTSRRNKRAFCYVWMFYCNVNTKRQEVLTIRISKTCPHRSQVPVCLDIFLFILWRVGRLLL
jgi:hypothetical protein